MSILRKSNKKTSARRQINIKGVQDGVLILPRGQYRAVLEVSSINFELKSEEEQDAIIDTFESFLNSLPCPLQILVRVREMDMDKYLADLRARYAGEKEKIYQSQLQNYLEFVQGLVRDNKILSRRFYVVLPHMQDENDFATVREQLGFNSDLVSKGLMRLGMRTRQPDSLEALDLFYSFYNPGQAKRLPMTAKTLHLLNSTYVQGAKA